MPWDTTSGTANATTDSSFVPRYLGRPRHTIPAYGTVGETGDILMFTTRNAARPFTGLCNSSTIQSDVAEVAWFMRGRTLYRRVLLVAPSVTFVPPPHGRKQRRGTRFLLLQRHLGTRRQRRHGRARRVASSCPTRWAISAGGNAASPTIPTISLSQRLGTAGFADAPGVLELKLAGLLYAFLPIRGS